MMPYCTVVLPFTQCLVVMTVVILRSIMNIGLCVVVSGLTYLVATFPT